MLLLDKLLNDLMDLLDVVLLFREHLKAEDVHVLSRPRVPMNSKLS